MKALDDFVVTEALLNEVGTLAAPSMLAVALRAVQAELAQNAAESLTLFSFRAAFKEGARLGDNVLATIEPGEAQNDAQSFKVQFGKSEETLGRVGRWELTFAKPSEAPWLPFGIRQAIADGRTDRELWRPQPLVATADMVEDAQSLLWIAGQSARAYMQRLDREFAASASETPFQDDVNARSYPGIMVSMAITRWPQSGWALRGAVQHQLPLTPESEKKMDFDGTLVAEVENDTLLLGAFRFTVARLSGRREAVYADGAKEPASSIANSE